MTTADLGAHYLETCRAAFRSQKRLADRAIAQLSPEQLHRVPHEDGNSVAVLMKHLAGNMLSRWIDFLTTDGEKPNRNRDGEFIDDFAERAVLNAHWEDGWQCLFEAVGALTAEDLQLQVTIRGMPHSVVKALARQVAHYGYHIGQIVLLARLIKGRDWEDLSVPRGESETFNRDLLRDA